MSRLPRVSVVVATFNRGYIVCEAIDSIIQQTYPNIEVIVVDDGSVDNTKEKLRPYGDRVRVLHQENSGPSAARNTGICAAHGSIICFLDSDDVYLPTYVARHVAVLERAGENVPCSLCNARACFVSGLDACSFEIAQLHPSIPEGIWNNVLDIYATRWVMCAQMLAVRRDVLERIGMFDPALRYNEDLDLAMKLALEGPWGFITEPLVLFRQSSRGDSLSLSVSRHDPAYSAGILAILQRTTAEIERRGILRPSRYLANAIRRSQRELWALQLDTETFDSKRLLARAALALNHYGAALHRRSPWYPKMKVSALSELELEAPTPQLDWFKHSS
jgi:glycosyltransferase involved in cell wall biosynthesis